MRGSEARSRRRWWSVDPYVAALLATVALAAVLPARGRAGETVGLVSDIAIGLLFFLYGARLSTQEALGGLRQWKLHLVVVAATFALFPLLGLAARICVPHLLTEQLYAGVLFLCVVPSTVQSSIALTSTARGDVPAAICAGAYSNLLGMALTPLLAAWLIGSQAAFTAEGLLRIAVQLLAPFIAGQLLHSRSGAFLARHKRGLTVLDRGSILLVVYTAFSAGMEQHIWQRFTPLRLAGVLLVAGALLAAALAVTAFAGRRLGFGREARVAIVFCGANKSLASGLPMAAVLFGPQAGPVILPLMLFHQLQLLLCAVIANRWAAEVPAAPEAESVPDTAPVP
ncbi:bile acid:sodium symporter family protein [Streptomyces sp. NBC_01565]|uniref:bile acid:sodium symporter family protein n=1 Tax=unclassified Streptomyces TaxID=2593676 RepID=UPI00224D6AA5|nr:bile acid:sodium symporter family protein [Streptomyces sp. NBC_01565]MCX4546234.1 bile acid:sodium symporter [Streptomyces sp. NBC_01565]